LILVVKITKLHILICKSPHFSV